MASTKKATAFDSSNLQGIIDTVREIQRTIEDQSGVDPEDGTACHPTWPTLRVKWRLNDLLNPSGGGFIWPERNLKKNPDIDEADLPRPVKIALRNLWAATLPVGWASLACGQPDEWLVFLDEITKALEDGTSTKNRPLANGASARNSPLAIDGKRIFINGTPLALDMTANRISDTLTFLAALIAEGGNWISSSEIDKAEKKKTDGNPGLRWDRIKKALPEEIAKYIESNRRKGYRIRVP